MLACGNESLNWCNRITVTVKVPQWTMTAGIENGIEIFHFHFGQFGRVGQLILGRWVIVKPSRCVSLKIEFMTSWVKRRLTTVL
jgi:hypothetical protein